MKYDITNKTQANRVLVDVHGKQIMIEMGKTRLDVDLDDATAARLREDAKDSKKPEVSIAPSATSQDANKPVADKPVAPPAAQPQAAQGSRR